MTQSDKMLMAVLSDENLVKFGGYDPHDYTNLYQALQSFRIASAAGISSGVVIMILV